VEYCVRKALEAKAQGVVFFILESDDAPSWDYPEQRKALEQQGIPSLCIDMQPYQLTDTESVRRKIESFLGNIDGGE
jgi:benzoyl-CoA reductase/2-hydroxyglutaryl-CoA dehydratase subunit BcrC/BadD/HgdB